MNLLLQRLDKIEHNCAWVWKIKISIVFFNLAYTINTSIHQTLQEFFQNVFNSLELIIYNADSIINPDTLWKHSLWTHMPNLIPALQMKEFSVNYLFSKYEQIRRKPADLSTFTKDNLNGKLHFLHRTIYSNQFLWKPHFGRIYK